MAMRRLSTPVNATMVTMNERFTSLQQQVVRPRPSVAPPGIKPASAKNRLFAEQLERKLTSRVALRIKKKSVQQRLGLGTQAMRPGRQGITRQLSQRLGIRGGLGGIRLNRNAADLAGGLVVSGGRGRFRGRRGGRGLRRGGNAQGLQRRASLQSLTEVVLPGGGRSRSRTRSRSRLRMDRSLSRGSATVPTIPIGRSRSRSRSRTRFAGTQQQGLRGRSRSRGRAPPGPRARSRGRGQRQQFGGRPRSRSRNRQNIRGSGRGSFGGGRRGRGRGRRGGAGGPVPTKEELDKQLDQYMSDSKINLG